MPTLAATAAFVNATTGTTAMSVAAFTPAVGEIIVVKYTTESSGTTIAAPSDTQANAYTLRKQGPTTGNNCWAAIYTATTSAATSNTVSSGIGSNSAAPHRAMVVERWTSASLAGTPATNATTTGTTTATTTLTTTAASSVISWVDADWSATAPGTPTYPANTTAENQDNQSPTFYVGYFGYVSAAAAGSTTFGVSTPTPQTWTLLGVEILNAGAAAAPIPLLVMART